MYNKKKARRGTVIKIENIETPALIIDMNMFEANQRKAQALVRTMNTQLRPHYKSHKSTAIAHKQIEAGAKGCTCAKLSEAEDLIMSGIQDVLIANQVVEPSKVARLGYLAGCCKLTVCVDEEENVLQLQRAAQAYGTTIYCLVEYEIGMKRCGVTKNEDVLALARKIDEQPNLVFEGIQSYAGHLSHESNTDIRKKEEVLAGEEKLAELVAFLKQNGISVKEISGASTGTMELRQPNTIYTEIQAGTYLFMDAAYDRVGVKFTHSLYVLTSVISADENRLVCDAGMKSHGVDQGNPVFVDFPEERVEMSEEHSAIYCPHSYKVGDKILQIPGHCCTTMNLHDSVYLVRDGEVVDRIHIDSRGKSW